MEGGAGGKK
jgi:hypothetical protein